MPSSSKNILKAIRQLINENTLENAQSLAGLIDVRLDDGLSDKYTDENYRYKDVGYIAGARKEQAQASILTAKKEGLQVFATDIDWDALEEDSRIAADTITKKNVFGQVDWDRLKAGGMHGNVGYLIKRIYAAVALKPDIDDAETRKLYVVAIQNLRQIFEKCKTYEDALNELVALSKLLNTYRNMVKGEDGKSTLNYDSLVAHALGKKFKSWVFKSGNKALHESKKMAIDDWSWLEPSDKMTTSAPKKKPFQLEAAADINRIGGAKVDIKSTEQFKDTFGLKAIQSGNWVLKDKESIEFHVQRSAEAMSDMADVTGIPTNLLGFGGRLGLAFGARGKGGALAHYEPVQRVINITKMKGGGSLGHEYFHALDNIIHDLIHQKDNGEAGYFATENPNLLPDGLVKTAFQALRQAMKVSARNSRMITITEEMRIRIKSLTVVSLIDNLRLQNVDLSTPNKLIEGLASYSGNRYTGVYKNKEITQQGVYVVLACMIHLGMMTGNENEVEFPVLWEQSDFEKSAIELDGGKHGKYWSKPLEMAARAYSAYLQDRLDEQGRVNDYLAYSTKGGNSRVGEVAYPQGEEREAINAAFDKLFLAIKKEQVFEKAVANKDLMDSIFGNTSANGVIKAIRTLLASNTFENAGTAVNTKIHVFERHNFKGDAPQGVISKNLSHYDDIEDLFDAIENINIKPRKPRVDEALAEYGLEIYPDRSKYIITGEGIKRKDITSTLFGSYIEKNKDGDVVDKYNRSTAFLKWLKDSQIPNMAQFNNGLSFNNLPIKYQQNTNKYNTWDGVGGMPDWLSTAINRYGAKLENFAVEKPVYDAVGDVLEAQRQKAKMAIDSIPKTLEKLKLLDETPQVLSAIRLFEKNLKDLTNAQTLEDYQAAFADRVISTQASNVLIGGKPNSYFNDLKALKQTQKVEPQSSNDTLEKQSGVKDFALILAAMKSALEQPTFENLQTLASRAGLGLIVKKQREVTQEQIKKYNEIAFSKGEKEAQTALLSDMRLLKYDATDRQKTIENLHLQFLETKKQAESAAKKAERDARPKIKPIVTALLAKPQLLRGKEFQFLEDIKSKRVLSVKQRDWLEAIAKRLGVAIDGDIGIKASQRDSRPKMSFEDWAEDFLDVHVALMGGKELEEVYKSYNTWFDDASADYSVIGPQAILAAMRQALDTPSDENIKALAELAGLSIEKPSPSDDLIPNFLKPYTPPTKNERAIESPEVEELAAFYAKESAFSTDKEVKALVGKDAVSYEHTDMLGQKIGQQVENPVTEFDIFSKYKNEIATDIVKEIKRVNALKELARRKGKYSTAEYNRKKIAEKWGGKPCWLGCF